MTKMPTKGLFSWGILALICVSTFINYLDRQTLSILSQPIQKALNFDDKGYAFVLNAFMVSYLLGTVGAGWIVEKVGTRLSLALFVGVWSLASAASGLAIDAHSLAVTRFVLGFAEVGNFIAAPALVAVIFPPDKRSLAVGLYTATAMLGAAICPPLITQVHAHIGWRYAFMAFGSVGFVWVVAWWLFSARLPADRQVAGEDRGVDFVHRSDLVFIKSWFSAFKYPAVWAFAFGGMLTYPVWYFYLNWFPKYLTDERGLSTIEMGSRAWVVYAFAGLGSIVGGLLPGVLAKMNVEDRKAKLTVLGLVAVLGPVGAFNLFAPPIPISLALGSAVAFFQMFWQVNLTALPSDYFDRRSLSKVYAIVGLSSGLVGIGTTWLIGQLVHQVSYRPMFAIMGLAYPVALALVLLLLKQHSPVPSKGAVIATSAAPAAKPESVTMKNDGSQMVAVVTGGQSGIGLATVERLRSRGFIVYSLDITGTGDGQNLKCDLTQPDDVDRATKQILERHSHVAAVVHCAAISVGRPLIETDYDKFSQIFDVNVYAAIRLVQAFSAAMAPTGGSFVFVSSVNARYATPGQGVYAASKAALDSVVKTFAVELADQNIRINTVQPASIDTPLLRRGYEALENADTAIKKNVERHPLGRWGRPEEVASLISFLVSEEAGWITGGHFPIDGGAGVTRR